MSFILDDKGFFNLFYDQTKPSLGLKRELFSTVLEVIDISNRQGLGTRLDDEGLGMRLDDALDLELGHCWSTKSLTVVDMRKTLSNNRSYFNWQSSIMFSLLRNKLSPYYHTTTPYSSGKHFYSMPI